MYGYNYLFRPVVAKMNSIAYIVRSSFMNDLSEVAKIAVDEELESTASEYLTGEEKKECVLSDPKFGMFSMFQYTWQNRSHNDNDIYCSKLFTPVCALPIIVFVAQWLMFAAILIYQHGLYSNGLCPSNAPTESKLLMCAISMVYFVNSFFLWDDVVDRTHRRKMIPAVSLVVLLDSFQEFSFSLIVYVTNILIIFSTESPVDMLFNCLALEFVMSLDNEFEKSYFKFHPEAAVDIYENMFVHQHDNRRMVHEKMTTSTCYCILRYLIWLPFKLLTILFMVLPLFCFAMVIFGTMCK